MRKHDLVIGLVVLGGCIPKLDQDETEGRHYTGAEWMIDRDGHVIATRAILVERSDAGQGRIIGVENDVLRADTESVVTLAGSLRGGVLRVVEVRTSGKRVVDLTPMRDDEFDERMRALDASTKPIR